jgi:hypothetical protein
MTRCVVVYCQMPKILRYDVIMVWIVDGPLRAEAKYWTVDNNQVSLKSQLCGDVALQRLTYMMFNASHVQQVI